MIRASVCLSVRSHISKTRQNVTKFSVHVTCGCSSVLHWWQCDMLILVDDITFPYNGGNRSELRWCVCFIQFASLSGSVFGRDRQVAVLWAKYAVSVLTALGSTRGTEWSNGTVTQHFAATYFSAKSNAGTNQFRETRYQLRQNTLIDVLYALSQQNKSCNQRGSGPNHSLHCVLNFRFKLYNFEFVHFQSAILFTARCSIMNRHPMVSCTHTVGKSTRWCDNIQLITELND